MDNEIPAEKTTEWNPAGFFPAQQRREGQDRDSNKNNSPFPPFVLLILNQEIKNLKIMTTLWNNASLRVCADGGANRLYDALTRPEEREKYIPNCIAGDLDSIRADVREYYEKHSVEIIKDPDQDSTDFGKCLVYIARNDPPPPDYTLDQEKTIFDGSQNINVQHEKSAVLALGGFGGRVDQSFHSIHTLFVASKQPSSRRRQIILISDENVTFLLEPGHNIIHTPRSYFGPTCGIIPVGNPSLVTTKGLEWNLTRQTTKFGGLVSTSNHLKSDVAVVDTSEAVVFTMEIGRVLCCGIYN